jgi:alkylhydroperoxidase family enzyme
LEPEDGDSKDRLVPYLPLDIKQPQPLVDEIRKRRGGTLLNLDRILLYNEKVAHGWNQYFGALRNSLSLDPKLRELAICYVGVLNKADYEVIQHTTDYVKFGGTIDEIEDLRMQNLDSFSESEKLILQLCEQMTFGNQV